MSYYKSFLSFKKLNHKKVSFLSIWDSKSTFTKKSHILAFAKLKNVQMGEYSRIGYNCNVTNTTIGRFTAIGRNCNIGLGQHPTDLLSSNSIFYKKGQFQDNWAIFNYNNKSEKINIGSDVWIGINVIIMDGVTIGNGAIIAAGSIVTKDVPHFAIVAGVPSTIKKYRFSEDVIKELLTIKWWDLSDDEIEKNLPVFSKKGIDSKTLREYFSKEIK